MTKSRRLYCVRLFKPGPSRNQSPEEADKIQLEHIRYLTQLRAEGKILINGPVIDDDEISGIGIFSTADKEEVRRLSDEDPAVRAGRLVYSIYHWLGMPGDRLPE